MGMPNLRNTYAVDDYHRSRSLTMASEPPNYRVPTCPRTPLPQGPHGRRSYQRTHSGPQNFPDSERRRREQYLQGNTLDMQLYAGLNGPPQREAHHRYWPQGVNSAGQSDGRSRTYSISSLRSNESQDSCSYSRQSYHPQYSTGSLHFSHRYNGASHSRSPVDYYQDGYQDDAPSVKSSRRSSTRTPRSLPLQFGQPTSLPPPPPGGSTQVHNPQYHGPTYEGERQKRISRRSSYSKLLGIASEEETKVDGEGYKVANESFRNSTYDWDLPGVRLSMVNLCLEGAETQPIPPESDEKEERKRLNDTKYTTTLESTSRPYTPDKFLIDRGHLKDSQANKTVKSASPSSATTKSSIWKLGKQGQGSPKTEENELDLDLVPTLTNEDMASAPKKEGKKLLKKFRPKKPMSPIDTESRERDWEGNGKPNVSFEGLFGRKSGGWREGDGAADIETGIEIDISHPYTATTEAGPSMDLISKRKGEPNRNINTELLGNQHNRSPSTVVASPTDRVVAYFRDKFEGLRRVITLSGGEYTTGQVNLRSKWKFGITTVKPKEIATAVTAEVVISGHKRIPSRASTPVQRTTHGRSCVERVSIEQGISRATIVQAAPTASLVKLKEKVLRIGTSEAWIKGENLKGKRAQRSPPEGQNGDSRMTRTCSSQTIASSFSMKVVPERIGTNSPSGFEVVGGRGAGRAWGIEALETVIVRRSAADAATTGNTKREEYGGIVRQGKQEVKKSVLKWLGGGISPTKEKLEPEIERVRTSISAGE